MRLLLGHQVSFLLAGLLLQIVTFEYNHGVDGKEFETRKREAFIKPLLEKLKKVDLLGSRFSSSNKKFGKSFIKSLSGSALDLLDSFGQTGDQEEGINFDDTLQETGKFLNTLTGSIFTDSPSEDKKKRQNSDNDPEVGSEGGNDTPESEELFTDFNENMEKIKEEFSSGHDKQSKDGEDKGWSSLFSSSEKKDESNSKGPEIFSIFKDLKFIFSIPIKVVHTKNSEPKEKDKKQEASECCKTFT